MNEYENAIKKIVHYMTNDGKSVFQGWFHFLKDKQAKIIKLLVQAKHGNFGDTKSIGADIHEMRIDYGPGYRIYYANEKETIIILLCGGNKSTQNEDIKLAKKHWLEHVGRESNAIPPFFENAIPFHNFLHCPMLQNLGFISN